MSWPGFLLCAVRDERITRMSTTAVQGRAIVVRVGSLEHLFNAPAVNPFSDNEVEIRGEAGMDYVIRHAQG
jgi:hypothetical protein